MTHIHDISQEDLARIIAFVEDGNDEALSTGAISKFYALSAALGRRLSEYGQSAAKKNFLLERKLERYQRKEKAEIAEGVFSETGLDSVDVALALLYSLQQLKTYQLTKSMLICILYSMYASWLGSKKERLFAEHPVATEWGPQFWRVYKRIVSVKSRVPDECYTNLARQNPAVAAFARNAARKYYDWKESDLRNLLLKSDPYKISTKEHNSGKWGKEIPDSAIYVWKTEGK